MAKATVEWLPDGSARVILPGIKASSAEEAQQIATDMIRLAAFEAGIDVDQVIVEDVRKQDGDDE